MGAVILGYLGIARLLELISLNDRLPFVLFGILLLFTGLQFVTLGLLAEMQSRTYHESQGKRIYAIRRMLGAPEAASDGGQTPNRP
jgi:hypothetical protein